MDQRQPEAQSKHYSTAYMLLASNTTALCNMSTHAREINQNVQCSHAQACVSPFLLSQSGRGLTILTNKVGGKNKI
jgi:hypothetical protein